MIPGKIRVRVAGLAFANGRILVVEHRVGDSRWWCFPGGTLEPGETPQEGVAREIHEESGLACEVGPLAAVGYHIDETDHAIELYYRCTIREEDPVLREATVIAAEFVDPVRLPGIGVFPVELAADLARGDWEGIRDYGRFA